jgi:hypothetical protein
MDAHLLGLERRVLVHFFNPLLLLPARAALLRLEFT